jgi:hypothetical protein
MAADEIRNLRYCYAVLRRRIAAQDDGLPYWRMNLRLAAFFLRRYDAEFNPTNWQYDDALSDTERKHILRTHTLLQRPTTDKPDYPKLTRELELNLRRRIARYLASL